MASTSWRSITTSSMRKMFIYLPLVNYSTLWYSILTTHNIVLHPYYKLMYIKMAWGGPEEQKKELEVGNPNAKDWCDKALRVVERTLEEYWQDQVDSADNKTIKATTKDPVPSRPLTSEFNCHHHHQLQKPMWANSGGWKEELCQYLTDVADDVTKNTDIIGWWVVCLWYFFFFISVLKRLQAHSKQYPTLAHITKDICAILVTSILCECLFSAGAEVATDRRSCLGAEWFEQLQVLKYMWWCNIVNTVKLNSLVRRCT